MGADMGTPESAYRLNARRDERRRTGHRRNDGGGIASVSLRDLWSERTLAGHSESSRWGNVPTESGTSGGDTKTRWRDEVARNSHGDRSLYPAGDSTSGNDAVRANVLKP